ncbi:MAG TPA: CHAT domain-containing protein [Myxococcaceae bacterium]|jgi:CHAT domain-containing protein/tetratricopeptide (TPR) repeat protein
MPGERRRAAAVLGALGALALSDASPAAPLEVEFAGCASVREDAGALVCETSGQASIRLWTAAPPSGANLQAFLDGRLTAATAVPLQGGVALDLSVPAEARELELVDSNVEARFRLRLRSREREPALDEAEQRRQQGKLDEAESLLAPLLNDPRPVVKARATGKLARIERWRGRSTEAVHLLRQAVELDRRAGLVSEAVFDGFVLSLTLRDQGRRFAEARAALDDIEPQAALFPQGRAMAHHYRAMLATLVGDLRAALRRFDASDVLSERLGLNEHRVDVLEQKAATLSLLGRHGEAGALLQQAGRLLPDKPCARAQWENDVGWSFIVARAAGGDDASAQDPVGPLQAALERYRTTCPNPVEACRSLGNLALAELQQGRLPDARRDLEASRRAAPHPGRRQEAWWLTLDARLALAEGRAADALAHARELRRLAESEALPDARIEAVSSEAQALDALGQVAAAREAYAEADALLEAWSLRAPLGEGRDGFVASHEVVTRRRVGFLVRRGEREADPSPWYAEAATAARLARARTFAALRSVDRIGALPAEARARWEQAVERHRRESDALRERALAAKDLPLDALGAFTAERAAAQAKLDADLEQALSGISGQPSLPALASGALLLTDFPVDGGWVAFAVTDSATAVHRLGALDAAGQTWSAVASARVTAAANPSNLVPPRAKLDQLSAQLLEPFRPLVEAAREIRFAPYGPLRRVDLHALPWLGAPLLERHPVLYPLDLALPAPQPEPERAPGGDAPLAAIVVDPRSDLVAARREGGAVAAALARRGWRTRVLEGPEATLAAVRQALESPETSLLHYAGHGNASGWDGWDSGLSLADGELRVPDVLALRRVPPAVVLSACDTAATNDRVPVEGLGAGQAFVLAGAVAVAAAVRPVDDQLAARLMAAMYASSPERPLDVAAALREAQMAEARRQPPGDWASFRVLAP